MKLKQLTNQPSLVKTLELGLFKSQGTGKTTGTI